MHITGSALFFGTSLIGFLLPNANASPLPTTTASVSDPIFHILPITLPTHGPHKINLTDIIFKLPTSLVKLPASLVKKNEHPEPTSLCGEKCKIVNGECKCPPKIPKAMCNAPCKFVEGECVCPIRNDTPWPFVGPDGLIPPEEETYPGATVDLTPIDPQIIASLEKQHRTLELRAVDQKKPQPTFFLCHEDPECNKGHAAPFTAEVTGMSKRAIGHPTLSHRADDAKPTPTQTSSTTHSPAPTALIPACEGDDVECLNDNAEPTPTQTSSTTHSPVPTALVPACACEDVKCLNEFQDNHKNRSKIINVIEFVRSCTLEHSPTPTAAVKECPENDRQCQGSFLPPPHTGNDIAYKIERWCKLFDSPACRGIPPAKAEKAEKRDGDIVLPLIAAAITELNSKPEKEEKRDGVIVILPNATAIPELTSKPEKEEERKEAVVVLPPDATTIPELSIDVHCNGEPWLCLGPPSQ